MEKKLNLHDLFGILFPGALISACAYIFLVQAGFLAGGRLDWSATLVMIPVAYAAGLFLHSLGSRLLHERDVAKNLMRKKDQTFTADFKANLKAAFTEVFKLPHTDADSDLQTLFDTCYDYVMQQGKGVYIENLYATYALCRSMVFISPISGILALWLLFPRRELPISAGVLAAGVVLLTIAATAMFWWAKDKYISRFAVGVYRGFYSAYCECPEPELERLSTTTGRQDFFTCEYRDAFRPSTSLNGGAERGQKDGGWSE